MGFLVVWGSERNLPGEDSLTDVPNLHILQEICCKEHAVQQYCTRAMVQENVVQKLLYRFSNLIICIYNGTLILPKIFCCNRK